MSNTSGSIKGSTPFSSKMKAVGRGVARAQQQSASGKTKMANGNDSSGGGSKPYGTGPRRGNGKDQTKSLNWKGVT